MPAKAESKNSPKENKLSHKDITEAAVDLIASKGLASLTMRQLAGTVGCSVGTLPHYFKNKHEVVTAALRWSNERILTRLHSIAPGDLSLDALTPVLFSSLPLDEQADLEWRVRLCLWEYATTNPEMLVEVEQVRKEAMQELDKVVEFLQQHGDIRDTISGAAVSATIYHLSIGLGFNLLHLPMAERQQQLDHLVDYIMSLRP